ncbi:Os07g0224550, partial [Oryza sativa Japonica Group]
SSQKLWLPELHLQRRRQRRLRLQVQTWWTTRQRRTEQSCRAVVREALPNNLVTRLPGADLRRRCGSGGPAPSDLSCAQAIAIRNEEAK